MQKEQFITINRKEWGQSRIVMLLAFIFLIIASTTIYSKTTSKGAIDAKTFDKLMRAQELTENDQHDAALQALKDIKKNSKLSGYAKAQMWNLYAFIYANQDLHQKSIESYIHLLAEPETPAGLKLIAKYTLAQLYFQVEDYASCIRYMNEWLSEVPKSTATAHIMLAHAYYQKSQYKPALKNIDQAIVLSNQANKPIKENWLRLKAAIHFEQKDYQRAANTYEKLIKYFPKISYFWQLAGMYGELDQRLKRIALYDAIYEFGALQKESEILNLAYMYLGQDVPYKAGRIIEQSMSDGLVSRKFENLEVLANAWSAASENTKAVPALEKVAKMSNKGLLYARLAGVHFNVGEYEKAAIAAEKADKKGGLKRKGNNLMLIGMAYFNQKEYEPALQAFRRAKKVSKSNFDSAVKWEVYTLREIKRLRSLEAGKLELARNTLETLNADENNVDAIKASEVVDQD